MTPFCDFNNVKGQNIIVIIITLVSTRCLLRFNSIVLLSVWSVVLVRVFSERTAGSVRFLDGRQTSISIEPGVEVEVTIADA